MSKQDVGVKILGPDKYQIQIKKDGVLSHEELKDFGQSIGQICEFAEYWMPYIQHDWTELGEPDEDGTYDVGTDLRTWIEIPIDSDLSEDEQTARQFKKFFNTTYIQPKLNQTRKILRLSNKS